MSLHIVLQARGKLAAVVGGGAMAREKTALLKGSGFDVFRFSYGPDSRRLQIDDLKLVCFVIAASELASENEHAERISREAGVLVNVADVPQRCDFYFPAVARRGALSVAVSSNGKSPGMAQWLRDKAGQMISEPMARLAEALGAARPTVAQRLSSFDQRRVFWRSVVGNSLDRLESGVDLETILTDLQLRVRGLEVHS